MEINETAFAIKSARLRRDTLKYQSSISVKEFRGTSPLI